ncbi:GPI-anchored adhesin-like protein PGA55 [Pyrus ussuriensis x Pyrus communis]|uniref:GPI-anchored adhesin-like protein PGA55 n=1 Tax=Pyrus ussuriensis x Pyrus communis TaxID=2448454 RepID=A0A5N5G3X4_9ROSA|nr:GPI-anchored adhesin-like protein PGA55 [Pyrus ussuriensis x Pyrus communis]
MIWGDPLRCLGESISFGRYMSEPLAWEKWSAFSHNRYLEEVEKFSKPGSVAQKKAYFEAHYKKKAAEKAAALLEVTNAGACNVTASSVTMYGNCESSSMDIESANGGSQMVVDKEQENVAPNSEVEVYSADVNSHNQNVEGNQLDIAKVEGAEAVIEEGVNLENSIHVEISNQFENGKDQNEIVATLEEKMPNTEASGEENLASMSKKRLMNSSPRLSTKGRAPKVPPSPAKQAIRVQTINRKNATQMASKRTSPVVEKTRNSRSNTTKLDISINNPASHRRTAIRASVGGVLMQSSVDPWSKDRRAKTLLNKSVAGPIGDGKWISSSKDQSSTANGSKPRPPIVSCPFRLKSEERAEKRKEFYQRLEEKKNAKEAEHKLLQLRSNKREKAVGDVNKLHQSTALKAKQNQDLSSGLQLSSNHLNKIPMSQSRSPKLGRHSTAIKILDSSSRPFVNSHSSKCVTQKYSLSTNRMVPSLSKKNAHENSPPNILS